MFLTPSKRLGLMRPPAGRRCVVRPRCVLLSLVAVCCVLSSLVGRCLCIGSRQQLNVWYSGLMITGIAVNEANGDVFFSDAAGRRVVHQSVNGTLLHVYNSSSLFSPMQLAYSAIHRAVYVADASSARLGIIDLQLKQLNFSSLSPGLSSCSALAVDAATGLVLAVDGWGLRAALWSPTSGLWSQWY